MDRIKKRLINPKPKFINGSLYPNAKMTVSNDMNPYAGKNVNKTSIADVYSATMEGPKVKQNLGAGPIQRNCLYAAHYD